MQNVLPIVSFIIMLVFFYLIVFIPENKRKKKYSAMLDSLKVNDEIMTRGGIMGSVVNIKDDYIILQTGPDKVRIKLSKSGISSIMNPENIKEAKTE